MVMVLHNHMDVSWSHGPAPLVLEGRKCTGGRNGVEPDDRQERTHYKLCFCLSHWQGPCHEAFGCCRTGFASVAFARRQFAFSAIVNRNRQNWLSLESSALASLSVALPLTSSTKLQITLGSVCRAASSQNIALQKFELPLNDP